LIWSYEVRKACSFCKSVEIYLVEERVSPYGGIDRWYYCRDCWSRMKILQAIEKDAE